MTARAPFIPDQAPFTEEQRAWLNGFLAGMFSQSPNGAVQATPTAIAKEPITILFGSQTGNAENLAKRVRKSAEQRGFSAEISEIDAFDSARLQSARNLLIITSTYGDGEPPDNARKLHRLLHSPAAPRCDHLRYSILALGDTNYPEFCKAGKDFDNRLGSLGANRIADRVDCDVDFDQPFSQWLEKVLAAIKPGDGSTPPTSHAAINAAEPTIASSPATTYGKSNPFPAAILGNKNLNTPGSAKETRHIEFSLEGSDLTYEAGDALAVVPSNCPDLVESFLSTTGFTGNEAVPSSTGKQTNLRYALTSQYDITKLTQPFLAIIAEKTGITSLRELAGPEAKDAFGKYAWGRDIVDVLTEYQVKWDSPAALLAALKKLAPRLYSISSSPKAHPGEVHLTVGRVLYDTHGRRHKGICSNFIAESRIGALVPVYIQPNKHFRPPANPNAPLIMVGPGTGIAPFRAFLEEREATQAKGKNWLFFGDQRSTTDYLYREQLERMHATGILTRLDTAFSRDQEKKIYVQDKMREHARELVQWLDEGAYFCVCGDASRMAKDVDASLHDIVASVKGISAESTAMYVERLVEEKRYLRDVY